MATQKQYLDYAGLSNYDSLLKAYIDSDNTLGIKTVLWDSTNEQIKFYKKPNATLSDTQDFAVSVASSDVANLKTRVGMSSTLNAYQTKNNLTDIMNIITGADTVDGSVAKIVKNAIEALDVTDTALATAADGVVTIKAIKEVDGKIAASEDTTKDVVLAKVATTGTAADVAIVDAGSIFAKTNVEEALQEVKAEADASAASIVTLNSDVSTAGSVKAMIKANAKDATYDSTYTIAGKIDAVASEAVVTVEKQSTPETGFAATYYVKQNGTKVGDSINVAKDWLLKSVEIKTCTEKDKPVEGYNVGDRYFDFEFNVKAGEEETSTHIYLKVEEMFDAYTSGSAETDPVVIVVDNDNNTISATVTDGTIARAKINADFEADIAALEATHAKSSDDNLKSVSTQIDEEAVNATYAAATESTDKVTIKDKIDAVETKITTEINALDATVSQSGTATETVDGSGLTLEVVEADGKLTSVSGSITTIPLTGTNSIASLFASNS